MKAHDLTAWLDGELNAEEQELVEQELAQNPDCHTEVASLIREQFLMAETLTEEAAQQDAVARGLDCPDCEAAEPSVEMLPNEEIFTAYIDGQLSQTEAQEVEAQIESDPVLKRELAEFCRQRFQLAEILEDEPAQATTPTLKFPAARTRPTVLASAHKSSTPWLKIAAMLAILAAGAWFLAQQYLTDPGGDTHRSASLELKATMGDIRGDVIVLRKARAAPSN